MSLILDIETVADPATPASIAAVSHAIKQAARDAARGAPTDEMRRSCAQAEAIAIDRLALSPWTGRVVVVAAWDTEQKKGVCLTHGAGESGTEIAPGFTIAMRVSEAVLLSSAWKVIREARQIVTWNGLDFDQPFLIGRSLVCGVEVDQRLLSAKPWESMHVDLCAKLGMGFKGRARLETACLAMSIPSPKDGIDGSQVSEVWAAGRQLDVARYCCGDVATLAAVHERWLASTGGGNG